MGSTDKFHSSTLFASAEFHPSAPWGALRARASPSAKQKCVSSKGHWKWVSESPCAATKLTAASIKEHSKPFPDAFKQMAPSRFFGYRQNPNMLHKRIRSSIAHKKLMQHIENINPKYASYTGWKSSTGGVSDALSSLAPTWKNILPL